MAATESSPLSLHDALPICYGPQLEVVGIAYEGSGTTQEQAVRVNAVGQRLGVNYRQLLGGTNCPVQSQFAIAAYRSEEHTSELQSRGHLVCRLLLEKKKHF